MNSRNATVTGGCNCSQFLDSFLVREVYEHQECHGDLGGGGVNCSQLR
jgi:hypothetical protein